MNKSKVIAEYGILVALALVLAFVESQIPVFFAVPGMKLGLTNLVVMIALYHMDEKSAISINIIRILLVSFMFGNVASLAYSLSGGLLSGAAMIVLKKTKKLSMLGVSVAGGVAHNIGQILAAMVLLETTSIGWYLLILWFAGIGAGAVIGIISAEVVKRLPIRR